MIAPVHRLKKIEIVWLAKHKCKHGHTYLEHYNCYLKEMPDGRIQEKVGFLDIETTGLDAEIIELLEGSCVITEQQLQIGRFKKDYQLYQL